jgi:serine protease Do
VIRTVLFWAAGALLLAGCSSSPSIPDTEIKAPLVVPVGAAARPVKFGHILVEVPRGTEIGESMGHLACYYTGAIKLEKSIVDFSSPELAIDFYHALKDAHIPAAGDPTELYSNSDSAAELEVSGVIDKVWLNVCHPNEDYNRVKGGASIHVTWHIYDPILRKVIYRTSTTGAFKDFNTGETNTSGFIFGAVDVAMQNLLADQGFHDVVMSDPMRDLQAQTAYPTLEIPPSTQPGSSLTDARAATVTIFGSTSSGSGVIVSPDGYVLTAYHVVEEGRVVRVRLATHRDVMGDVVRTDAIRDVALIKLAEYNLPAAKVRIGTEPEVGDTVFAIGSPFGEENDNTVTQGVVSTYRTTGGMKFIQSDVSIQHGNSGGPLVDKSGRLIGLTDLGRMAPGDVSEGINLFVPIGEAMERLKIRYPTDTASGHMQ